MARPASESHVPASQPYRLPVGGRVLPMAPPNDCVVALRALGEDTRVRIVGLLMEHPLDVGAIAQRLDLTAYNASKHLRVLREAGLLEVVKDGRQRLYGLPGAITRQAAEGQVLDLGCCSFQFREGDDEAGSNGNGARQAKPQRRGAHKQHARRK
jgi:DNA-binding transcriptional ArsR family regulator